MSAIDVLLGRLTKEEGERAYPYDDKTGIRVHAPEGKITWGRGFNLEECGSPGLFDVMERYLVAQVDKALHTFAWYAALDDVRQSVCLDIAYNAGLSGFVDGFPHCIAALARGDISAAVVQLHVEDPSLDASRYAPLRTLLLNGAAP